MQSVVLQWYATPLRALLSRRQNMPHAVLLTGPEGTGKEHFAGILATSLLCSNPSAEGFACGECQSCQLHAASTHPDFYRITLESNVDGKLAKDIKVEQIRQLIHSLSQTSQLGGRKITIIDPAERMNRNAANSLLKTLEEPTADTLLVLLAAQPSRLLPTVRSRCQRITLKPPSRELVVAWLRQQCPEHDAEALYAAADGAPFAALELATGDTLNQRQHLFKSFCAIAEGRLDPISAASDWAKSDSELVFRWLRSWVCDLIGLACQQHKSRINNTDLATALQRLTGKIDLRSLFDFRDTLLRSGTLAQGSANLQLLHESLLLEWSKQCAIKS